MASGDTKTEQLLQVLANGGDTSSISGCCNTKTQDYILGAIDRIQQVEDEVERLENNPDVVDIVATYQELQAYDTSGLTDKDIIRVLSDSTHDDNSTYYRWNATTQSFDFVGEISGGGGSGDSVYSDKTTSNSELGGAVYIGNLNASQQEQSDPTTTDYHYKYFWALPNINTTIPQQRSVNIMGSNASADSVVIGDSSNNPVGTNSVAIGGADVRAQYGVGIGYGAYINNNLINAIALGSRSNPTRSGEVNIGNSIGSGYNNTNYRVLGGVHDGQLANDAVTVGQVNAVIDAINSALGSSISHIGS